MGHLSAHKASSQTPLPTLVPTCPPPYSTYGCVLPTLQAGATQTTQAQTATPVLPSVTAPSLLATPTAFTPSSTCPPSSFDETNLDPQWSAVCSHCLDGASAALFPTFSFSTQLFSTQSFSTQVTTPELTPTFTPTVGATPTSSCPTEFSSLETFSHTRATFVPPTDGGIPQYSKGVVGVVNVFIDLGAYYYVDRIDSNFYGQAIMNNRCAVEIWANGIQIHQERLDRPGWAWINIPVPKQYVRFIEWHLTPGYDSDCAIASEGVRVRICGSAPTPTTPPITPTSSPSPSPTFGFATQPALSFSLLADCRVPVYRTEPNMQAVAFDITTDTSACYRLFPEVDLQVLEFSVQIQAIDFCFQFYSIYLEVVGIVVPINLLIDASLALFLVKWGLFN